MTAKLIDGKAIALALRETIKTQVSALRAAGKRPPGLAVVLVGADRCLADLRAPQEPGLRGRRHAFAGEAAARDSHPGGSACRGACSSTKTRPSTASWCSCRCPKQIASKAVIDAIAVEKDVDGFNPENLGLLAQRTPRLRPCTPYGCIKMLEHEGIDPRGMDAVVIGQSNIVGRPMALELLMKSATVTICHSNTRDLPGHVRRADLVVAGIGKPEMVKGEWIKPGAVVHRRGH